MPQKSCLQRQHRSSGNVYAVLCQKTVQQTSTKVDALQQWDCTSQPHTSAWKHTEQHTKPVSQERGEKKHRWRDVPLFPETNKPFFPKNKCSLDINRLCLSEEHLCLCLGQCKLKLHTTASSPTWATELWQTFNFYLSQTTHNIHSFLWCYKSTSHWDFRRSVTIPQTIFSSCDFAYWSGIDKDGLILH